MYTILLKYFKKLAKDRVLHKTILHLSVFSAVLALFVTLTVNHVITTQPQLVLPSEYSTLPSTTLSKVDLEQKLRSKSPEIQGLVTFKGLNSIVVMGSGLEHDQLVTDADVDEMRQLATADKISVTEAPAATDPFLGDTLNFWWYVAAIAIFCWFFRLIFFKREKKQVYSRFRVFCRTVPTVFALLVELTRLKPSRFYLALFAGLIAINAGAFALRFYHDKNLYVAPPEVAGAQHLPPWQIQRHLSAHPEEFLRVSFVDELNTAYVVLNSRSVPVPKGKDDYSDDDDSSITAADSTAPSGIAPAPAVSPTTGAPVEQIGPRSGGHPISAVPQPPKMVIVPGGHKPVMVERTIDFGNTAQGKLAYAAFVGNIHADKIESKTVPAVHETGYIDSLTVRGRVIMGILLLFTVILGGYIVLMWGDWHAKENPPKPGEVPTNPRLLGIGGALGNGGSAAPVVTREEDKKTFADVAGCQEAIDELIVVKKKIRRPRLYKLFFAPVPTGVILYGDPGTGKTLLARALAGEVGGSFQALSGSEFVEMYVGVGAKRVREAYTKARADAKKTGRISIIFIDEFDALAKKRGASSSGGDREYEQTLNELLVQMQGFGNHGLVLTMAATNRLDILDEAVLRPGRFDIKVKVPKPDKKGRAQIYGIYLKKLKLVLSGEGAEYKSNYDKLLEELARRSHDFSGAEIEGAIKDGATIAVERQFGHLTEDITTEQEAEYRDRAIITENDLHLGIDKMAYGTQIRSRVRTDKERWATAVHEIGHASVPTEYSGDPVNRITIVMTDKSLGLMDSSPEEGERYDWTDEQFIVRLRMMLAGRAAEKVILQKISTGASNDFERASQLARQMVGVYGMSEEFGNKSIPLDQAGFPTSNIGETLMVKFNDAWCRMIDKMQVETEAHITRHREQIEHAAKALFDEETLTGEEFRRLWAEKAPRAIADQSAQSKPEGEINAQ